MLDKNHKNDLRQALLASRQAVAAEVRQEWDAVIRQRVLEWWTATRARSLGVYWPIRGEPDLRPAYEVLFGRGVQLALPLVVDKNQPLQFAAWGPSDRLVTDRYGIAVPAAPRPVHELEALLIPCVGFTTSNLRLGYGGGFYDRTLAVLPSAVAVGIAYACTRTAFPAGPHDVALHTIITN